MPFHSLLTNIINNKFTSIQNNNNSNEIITVTNLLIILISDKGGTNLVLHRPILLPWTLEKINLQQAIA